MVKCYRCDAIYTPGGWAAVWPLRTGSPTSSPRYALGHHIPDEHCPVCRKPPRTEPYPEARPM